MTRWLPTLLTAGTAVAVVALPAATRAAPAAKSSAVTVQPVAGGLTFDPAEPSGVKGFKPTTVAGPTASETVLEFDLAAGDTLAVGPAGASRTFVGKRVAFTLAGEIKSERTEGCTTIKEEAKYRSTFPGKGPTLTLGEQVKIVVEISYKQGRSPETMYATFDKPVKWRMADGGTVRVSIRYDESEVAFAPRAVTAGERQKYIDPEVDRLRTQAPHVENPRAEDQKLLPGTLGELAVTVGVTRDQ